MNDQRSTGYWFPMSNFPAWLKELLTTGESVMPGPPVCAPGDRPAALAHLRADFARQALDVAGPPLDLDPAAALTSAEHVASACWRLVSGEAGPRFAAGEPTSCAAHLSADVTLRFLPAVVHRARRRPPENPLAAELTALLGRWPLSGVLADLHEPPRGDLSFGGHPGLQLLYAERLVRREKPGWMPPVGPTRERVELVYRQHGLPPPARAPREEPTVE
jgi:hypothetical protein